MDMIADNLLGSLLEKTALECGFDEFRFMKRSVVTS